MTLGKFIKGFYGNNAVIIQIQGSSIGHSFYENALFDIPEEQLEYKVLAIYPWNNHCIGITCKDH